MLKQETKWQAKLQEVFEKLRKTNSTFELVTEVYVCEGYRGKDNKILDVIISDKSDTLLKTWDIEAALATKLNISKCHINVISLSFLAEASKNSYSAKKTLQFFNDNAVKIAEFNVKDIVENNKSKCDVSNVLADTTHERHNTSSWKHYNENETEEQQIYKA